MESPEYLKENRYGLRDANGKIFKLNDTVRYSQARRDRQISPLRTKIEKTPHVDSHVSQKILTDFTNISLSFRGIIVGFTQDGMVVVKDSEANRYPRASPWYSQVKLRLT